MDCSSDQAQSPDQPTARPLARALLLARHLAVGMVAVAVLLCTVSLGVGLVELGRALDAAIATMNAATGTVASGMPRAGLLDHLLATMHDLLMAAAWLVLAFGLYQLLVAGVAFERGSLPARLLRMSTPAQLIRRLAQLLMLLLVVALFRHALLTTPGTASASPAGDLLRIGLVALLIALAVVLTFAAAKTRMSWHAAAKTPQLSPALNFWVRLPVYTLLGGVILWMNPFGISQKADQASQDAIYRVIAPFYDDAPMQARDRIVVVLLDENAILQLAERGRIRANEWPIRYHDHAAILQHIIAQEPRALFVDVFFKRQRSTDPSLDRMIERLKLAKPAGWNGLIFAGGYANEEPGDMRERLAEVAQFAVTGWGGYGRGYPLKPSDDHTAAWKLYQQACLGDAKPIGCAAPLADEVQTGAALSVRWGSDPALPVLPAFVQLDDACITRPRDGLDKLLDGLARLAAGLSGADETTERERCPYHQTLFAHDLVHVATRGSETQRTQLREALRDKIVLYGVALSGFPDSVLSPVHGLLPGVMLHAMALDNLMSLGRDYTRAASPLDTWRPWFNPVGWFLVVLLLCAVLYGVERRELTQAVDCTRRRRHSRRLVYGVGLLAVIILSWLSFVLLHYEPLNAVGFLALTVLVGQLVHGDLSGKLIRMYCCYRNTSDTARAGQGAVPCLAPAVKEGSDDAQKKTD